jgi:hypothetical protein
VSLKDLQDHPYYCASRYSRMGWAAVDGEVRRAFLTKYGWRARGAIPSQVYSVRRLAAREAKKQAKTMGKEFHD